MPKNCDICGEPINGVRCTNKHFINDGSMTNAQLAYEAERTESSYGYIVNGIWIGFDLDDEGFVEELRLDGEFNADDLKFIAGKLRQTLNADLLASMLLSLRAGCVLQGDDDTADFSFDLSNDEALSLVLRRFTECRLHEEHDHNADH